MYMLTPDLDVYDAKVHAMVALYNESLLSEIYSVRSNARIYADHVPVKVDIYMVSPVGNVATTFLNPGQRFRGNA